MKEEVDKLQKAAMGSQIFINVIKKVCINLRPISKLAMIWKKKKAHKFLAFHKHQKHMKVNEGFPYSDAERKCWKRNQLHGKIYQWKFLRKDEEMTTWRRIWIPKTLTDRFCFEPGRMPRCQCTAQCTELKVCVI